MKRALLLFVFVGACNWGSFDDLSNETWVHTQDKPDGTIASDFGVAVAPAAPSSSQTGGRLVVLGSGQTALDVISYDASGKSSSLLFESRIAATGIMMYPDQPLLLKPHTAARANEVALVVPGGDGTSRVVLAQGLDTMTPSVPTPLIVQNNPTTDAATYLVPPGASTEEMLVGSGSTVFGFDLASQATKQCALADKSGAALTGIAALAAIPGASGDQVAVWGKDGFVYVYPGTIWNGCASPTSAIAQANASFMPGTGARIDVGANNLALLAAQQAGANGGPNETASLAVACDLSTGTPNIVGSPVTASGLHASAIATFGTQQYAILGYPQTDVNGTTAAGTVELHAIDATAGIAADATVTLSRAQPDTQGQFGRDVTTMSFNGETILVIAEAGHVFAYYELPPEYSDARTN